MSINFLSKYGQATTYSMVLISLCGTYVLRRWNLKELYLSVDPLWAESYLSSYPRDSETGQKKKKKIENQEK